MRSGKFSANSAVKSLSTLTGGSYKKVSSFHELKHRMHMLGQNCQVQATLKMQVKGLEPD
jgi:hypothetical protein